MTPKKSVLVGMLATLRGQLYGYLFTPDDIDPEETKRLLKDTCFDPSEKDFVPHSDGGTTFDRSWDSRYK